MNKEHIFPMWLLQKTRTEKVLFNWIYNKATANKCTIPLCKECNEILGEKLENPMSKILNNIESGKGFNDSDADIIIRWLWKIAGMFYWSICNENWQYGIKTLKQIVTQPIEMPRSRLSLAISLAEDEYDKICHRPVGLDVFPLYSNIFTAGVFSKTSFMIFYSEYKHFVPEKYWTIYTLSDTPMLMNPNLKAYPKFGFLNSTQAITQTRLLANSELYTLHENKAIKLRDEILNSLGNLN